VPYRSVPEALDLLDAALAGGKRDDERRAVSGGLSPITPLHVLHVASNGASAAATGRVCPATEPEVPNCWGASGAGNDCPPFPPVAAGTAGAGVLIGVCDTGLLDNIQTTAPWLANATGETDPLGPLLAAVPPIPPGLYGIPQYAGHGSFVAGVALCQAPGASAYVTNGIVTGGGVLETTIVARLEYLLASEPGVDIVNLSAGGYTRHDFDPLSFTVLDLGGVPLIAAAGNDATHRKFWPAAFDWVVGVGALGADQRDRAWFSNHGDWVDVYTIGEGLVNAYATGVYTYQEPPKRPHKQIFDGRARWSGTSFAAPLVAGVVAAQMAGDNGATMTAADAVTAVLELAADPSNAIPGVGPAIIV
jgi:hypothetical protein